jgi:hypothetical protein
MIIQKGEGVDGLSYIKQPDEFGPKWTLRFIFIPVIPPPGVVQEAHFSRLKTFRESGIESYIVYNQFFRFRAILFYNY